MISSTSAIASAGGVKASTVMPDFGASMRARSTVQVRAGRRAADVRRAQVERLARDVHLDRVQKLAVQHLHPHDMRILRRDELLHQRGRVQAELPAHPDAGLSSDAACSCESAIEALHARTRAADIGLHHDGPAQAFRSRRRLRRAGGSPGPSGRRCRASPSAKLAGLAEFGAERLEPVDHLHAAALQVLQKAQRVEDLVAVVAVPCRGLHAVEDQRVLLFRVVGRAVEVVTAHRASHRACRGGRARQTAA